MGKCPRGEGIVVAEEVGCEGEELGVEGEGAQEGVVGEGEEVVFSQA